MVRNSKLGYTTSPKSVLRPSVAISIIASLLVGTTSFYTIKLWQNSATQEVQVPAKQLPQLKTVTALGRIEPQGEVIKLSAAGSGEGSRVEKLLVKEGDRIKAGQVIAILSSHDRLEAALKEAQSQVKVAQANFNRTQAGAKPGEITAQKAAIARLKAERLGGIDTQAATIAKFQAEVGNAQVEDERYEQLYQQGAISASQHDSKRLNLKTAQKNLQLALAQLNRTQSTSQQQIKEATATLDQISEVRGVDLAAAQAEVDRALAAMNLAKVNLKQAEVRSPQNGQIFKIHTHPGELISNDGIAEIGQTSQMYVIAEVYESDIDKVHSGQKVRIFGDFLPIELEGIVDRKGLQVQRQNVIDTDPASNIDSRVVEVHIQLARAFNQKAANLTNMQVKAVIEISH